MSVALSLYLSVSRLAAPVAGPILRRRLARGKEDPERLHERLGRPDEARPDGPLVWLHGASVGEAVSALPLINALAARSEAEFLLTTGTVTSARRMARDLPDCARHQFVPVDTASAVRGFLDHWRPDLAIWIESELWPRLVVETSARAIPMAMVNARISDRSARRWTRAPRMARRLLGAFATILAQDGETVDRMAALGVEARFAGNLKAAVPPPPADEAELAAIREGIGERAVWLAASTHPGEDEIVAEAQRLLARQAPAPALILAPRHPERADAIAELLGGAGLRVARRSKGETLRDSVHVLLADTLGEMGLWYRLAPVSFVAGSLAEMGGHTPFEPAALDSAVLHGPNVANFAPAYRVLSEADAAIQVADAPTLAVAVRALLDAPDARAAMTRRAARVLAAEAPDLDAVSGELLALIEGRL